MAWNFADRERDRAEAEQHRRNCKRAEVQQLVYQMYDLGVEELLRLLLDRSEPYPSDDPVRPAIENFITAGQQMLHKLSEQPIEESILPLPNNWTKKEVTT